MTSNEKNSKMDKLENEIEQTLNSLSSPAPLEYEGAGFEAVYGRFQEKAGEERRQKRRQALLGAAAVLLLVAGNLTFWFLPQRKGQPETPVEQHQENWVAKEYGLGNQNGLSNLY